MSGNPRERLLTWFHERGLSSYAADLLDAARPITPLLAQVMYIMDPLFHSTRFSAQELGTLFEDPEQIEYFISDLREEDRYQ
jgi:hypothetical protein